MHANEALFPALINYVDAIHQQTESPATHCLHYSFYSHFKIYNIYMVRQTAASVPDAILRQAMDASCAADIRDFILLTFPS